MRTLVMFKAKDVQLSAASTACQFWWWSDTRQRSGTQHHTTEEQHNSTLKTCCVLCALAMVSAGGQRMRSAEVGAVLRQTGKLLRSRSV